MNTFLRDYYASALIWPRVLAIGVFAYIGFIVLGSGSAATFTAPAEAENFAIAGNAKPLIDADASAKTAVLFGDDGLTQDGQGDRYLAPQASGFMPYTYVATGQPSLVEQQRATGTKRLLAGFIQAGEDCSPRWQGIEDYGLASPEGAAIKQDIQALRAAGGDVAVAFGGGFALELADACDTVETTQLAYQNVITQYGLTQVDFTLSGYDQPDTMLRRALAIYGLQRQNPGLRITVSIPVNEQGIADEELAVLRQLREAGVVLSGVGLLVYDSSDGQRQSGAARTIAAANEARRQLRTLYPGASPAEIARAVRINVVIGYITENETFDLADARLVRDYAVANAIGGLGFWHTGRDQACPTEDEADLEIYDCSGVAQTAGQFGSIFRESF